MSWVSNRVTLVITAAHVCFHGLMRKTAVQVAWRLICRNKIYQLDIQQPFYSDISGHNLGLTSKTTTLFVQHTVRLSLLHRQSKSLIYVKYIEFSIWVLSDQSGCNAEYVQLYVVKYFKIRVAMKRKFTFADRIFVVYRALWLAKAKHHTSLSYRHD